jgi:hypothetical protein
VHAQTFVKAWKAVALAAWSSGIVTACGVMGREIESRQGGSLLRIWKVRRQVCTDLPD